MVITTVLAVSNNFKEYEIKEKCSFSEIANTSFLLNDKEKSNIINKLKSEHFESNDYFGFKTDTVGTDLYFANSLVEIAKTLNNNKTLNALKEKTNILNKVDPHSLSILNLIYYINICKYFNINYNENEVLECLEKFYDSQDKLFFLNDSKDTINVKIVITALCYKAISNILSYEKFDIIAGIQKAYDNYKFSTDKSITIYNSGGDILYGYSILGRINDSVLSNHREWFEFWKNQYETMTINSIDSALAYSEYYNIAIIFDKNYSNEKIQSFYNKLTKDDLPEDIDFYMLNNSIKNAIHFDNNNFNSYVINKVDALLTSKPLFEMDIDVMKTVYGGILAKNTAFEIDKQKLQTYINQNYNKINNMEHMADIINNLYYTIILDELNNNYHITKDAKYIQNIIDKSIKTIAFKEDINNDILIARKALEIVMDLQLHDTDIRINVSQINKIKKGLEKALNNKDIINSVLITDLFIINDITNAGFLNNELFYNVYKSLTIDGGSKAILTSEQYPNDINTTYRFFVCFDRMNNYTYLPEQKKYAESLQLSDGIYRNNSEDNSYVGLESILYGNSIIKLNIGGDK